jgi:hypothetical protein
MTAHNTIFIAPQISTDGALRLIGQKLDAMRESAPLGFQVDIQPHKKQRTYQQNSLYWAVVDNIVRFANDTGFRPELLGVMPRVVSRDLLHELIKLHFSVPSTAKLSTAEFGRFIDALQLLMTEQSRGEYNPIIPDEPYLSSLGQ